MVIDRIASLLLSGAMLVALSTREVYAQLLPAPTDDAQREEKAPARPQRPLAPAEMPPNPPRVTCNGGQLTIAADNSTMGSVLAAVRSCINVTLDLPEGSSATRMYMNLGPGPAYQVLESLLGSTDLDYVIQTSESHPETIQTVLLLARAKDPKALQGPANLAQTPARRAWLESRRNSGHVQEADDESSRVEAESIVSDVTEKVTPSLPTSDSVVPSSKTIDAEKPIDISNADTAQTFAKTPAISSAEAALASTSASTDSAAPVVSDPSADSPAAKETQNKITKMEQMFEQRKQKLENQIPAPNQ
jgi:hypothetical protein